jgi:hypothetical protein
MPIFQTRLIQAAGIAAAVAGLIFIAVQINHPPLNVSTITTTEVAARSTAKLVMGALALAGITGMYLRQVRQAGALGLIGYLLLVAFYLVLMPIEFTAAYVLPSLADTDPSFVNDVLAVAEGGTAAGDIGQLQIAFYLAGGLYLAGGVVFGIALLRARVLARWPAALLIIGAAATLALSVLPESYNRPFAIPTGVALVGLGISLWREQFRNSSESVSRLAGARRESAGVE